MQCGDVIIDQRRLNLDEMKLDAMVDPKDRQAADGSNMLPYKLP